MDVVGVWRLVFGVWRLAFGVRRSANGRTGDAIGRAKNSARRGHRLPEVAVRAGFEPWNGILFWSKMRNPRKRVAFVRHLNDKPRPRRDSKPARICDRAAGPLARRLFALPSWTHDDHTPIRPHGIPPLRSATDFCRISLDASTGKSAAQHWRCPAFGPDRPLSSNRLHQGCRAVAVRYARR